MSETQYNEANRGKRFNEEPQPMFDNVSDAQRDEAIHRLKSMIKKTQQELREDV